MKKTTKKISINKEIVTSFSTMSEKEIVAVNGGKQELSVTLSFLGCADTLYF